MTTQEEITKQKTQFFDSDRGDANVEWSGLIYPSGLFDLQKHAKATNMVNEDMIKKLTEPEGKKNNKLTV